MRTMIQADFQICIRVTRELYNKLPKLLCTIKHASSFKHKMTVLNFMVFYSKFIKQD